MSTRVRPVARAVRRMSWQVRLLLIVALTILAAAIATLVLPLNVIEYLIPLFR